MYGNGLGGELPDDLEDGMNDGVVSTHLINFAPGIVTGTWGTKPKWFIESDTFPGVPFMRCYLACHGVDMTPCAYAIPDVRRNFQCQEGC